MGVWEHDGEDGGWMLVVVGGDVRVWEDPV